MTAAWVAATSPSHDLRSRSYASRSAVVAIGIIVAEPRRGEEGLEPVEVGLPDRVELVVVAPGAADRQPEEDQARRLGDVVQGVLPAEPLVVEVHHVGVAAIEAGGDERGGVVGPDLVARELEARRSVS